MVNGWQIKVSGLVQGVGFRPTVWQVANSLGITGSVRNTSAGVTIQIQCDSAARDRFVAELKASLPKLARIDSLEFSALAFSDEPETFSIDASEGGNISASVVADAMICQACTDEIREPQQRRRGYPFTNCTHCGPRLTIIRKIPYDRANTAMADFPMCPACEAEYGNPADRRFHAEPIACAACGPKLWLETAEGFPLPDASPMDAAALLIGSGRIVALKGLGGFHLACRADDEAAVRRLRLGKLRPDKPLALMVASLDAARSIAVCSDAEAVQLADRSGPIVLLRHKPLANIAPSVAPRQNRIGIMLPTTPLHVLLMDRVGSPLVMTSANESGIPQCINNDDARGLLGICADAILMHDRDIAHRVDDSVVRLDAPGLTLIRRARGYAPEPVLLPAHLHTGVTVFAAGADLKSAFAFSGRGDAILSQHLGDLDEPETRDAYRKAVDLYAAMFERKPGIVAVDAHPGYVSSNFGRFLAKEAGAKLVPIQHHHAHLAACMAENGMEDANVLGIVLDGTGFGDDGTIWGGEFLAGGYRNFTRVAHFLPVPLIGSDKASLEPWRNGFAHLVAAFGENFRRPEWADIASLRQLESKPVAAIHSVMKSQKLSPLSSSAGRLFDAAAFLIGSAPEVIGYEGQAAMELEAIAGPFMARARSDADPQDDPVICWNSLWAGLLEGLKQGRDIGHLAADFHLTLIDTLASKAIAICDDSSLDTVALTGGVFQNAILLEGLHARLASAGLRVLTHHKVPANDGGIALGQIAIALARHNRQ